MSLGFDYNGGKYQLLYLPFDLNEIKNRNSNCSKIKGMLLKILSFNSHILGFDTYGTKQILCYYPTSINLKTQIVAVVES